MLTPPASDPAYVTLGIRQVTPQPDSEIGQVRHAPEGTARTGCPLWQWKQAAACEETETRGTVARQPQVTEVRRWARR
ncbi:hypothetical protein Abr02nite_62540 [Paractinoplanes brasiliensis]|nr:hypothetical protein Abr02nite_62540 [Actinoplanes brasiliensis]